jgi:hypothetical protein
VRRVAINAALLLPHPQRHRTDLPSVHRQSRRQNDYQEAQEKTLALGQIWGPSAKQIEVGTYTNPSSCFCRLPEP